MKTVDLKAPQTAGCNRLVDHVGKVFILAYKEDTQLLEETLVKEGFQCEVLRQVHQEEYKTYSSSYLCLLNHRSAWERATQESQPTLIIEADFVPVIGFGKLPMLFDGDRSDTGVAWLYTCAPQIYTVSQEGYAEGFSTGMVAYLVNSQSARHLIGLAEAIRVNPGPTSYSAWDSTVERVVREKGLKNYVPFRNYGEHGGKPNPEHRQNGLSPTHRADVLYGRLAFLPPFATLDKHPRLRFLGSRLLARWKGLVRLLGGKFLRVKIVRNSSYPLRLVGFAIRRQLSLYP